LDKRVVSGLSLTLDWRWFWGACARQTPFC